MELQQLYKYFSSHPEGKWIMQWQNAVELYNYIKEKPVKRILALGTGIGLSDAVIALAMKDKGETDYRIDSMEQYDKCVLLAKQIIPKELSEHITIHKSDVEVWSNEKMPYHHFSIYSTLPEGEYDLIINDGPAPFMAGEHYIDLPNGTIHKMLLEDKLKAGTCIIYDGRVASLRLIERFFGDNFFLTRVPSGGNDFSVIERKNNPPALKDEKLEVMRNLTNYFKDASKKEEIKEETIHEENTLPSDQSGAPSETETPIDGVREAL